jgi:ATP-dependent Clp protease ATP-binding subunit ClpA
MSKNSYEVRPVSLKEADNFEVLVLTLPENDIEDKLTYLTREKGKISRSFYEDFVIANCVANINQLLSYINQNLGNQPDLLKIRAELMANILDYNQQLAPENLIINKNYVVKIKKYKRLKSGEKYITENSSWDTSYYENLDDEDKSLSNIGEAKKKDIEKLKSKVKEKIKDIDELEYDAKQVWWKRIGQYIEIKKFNENDTVHILKKRYFHSPTSFNTFIVSVCIVGFEDLFMLLDNMGIPSRVAPPILMNELYELCRSLNKFLTYTNAQELSGDPKNISEGEKGKKSPKTTTAGLMHQYSKTKSKKKFKDIPKKDLLKLADNMKVFLIGQDPAVDILVDTIQRAKIGLKDPVKPIGSFLFAGRTGVGKTLATKVLADELIKNRDNLITIDCSEYSADHEYSKLIGSPAGYIGHEQGGNLTNAISKNPFSVIVFDEVEKASSKVHELMLQILEEGRLTDGQGKSASFKDSIIVMTSNVGANEIDSISKTIGFGDVGKITDIKKDAALNEALKRKFKPEFLNRIDSIVNFKTLVKKDYMRIIDIELYKLETNLKNNDTDYKDLGLEFDKSVKNFVYKHGIDEKYGARPLKRCIEREISTPLSKKILREDVGGDSVILISVKRGKIMFEISEKIEETPFYMSDGYQVVNGV